MGTVSKRRKLGSESLPMDSRRTLVLAIKSSSRNSKGSSRAMALNERRIVKIRSFQPIRRRISETVHDRTKITIND